MKKCCTCHETKPLDAFGNNKSAPDGLEWRCKACRAAKRAADKEGVAARNKRYRESQGDALRAKKREYRAANADKINAKLRDYFRENRERLLGCMKEYRVTHADAISAQRRQYRQAKSQDPVWRMTTAMRTRIAATLRAFRDKGKAAIKHGRTRDLLGLDFGSVTRWLEFQFEPGMSWSNYGTHWHVDHVLPVAAFDLAREPEQRVCFRSPSSRRTTSRSDKILLPDFFNVLVSAHRFIRREGLGRPEYQALAERLAWLRATTSDTVTSSSDDGRGAGFGPPSARPETGNPQPSS